MLLPRYLFGASAVNGRVYAVGGLRTLNNVSAQFPNDVEVYDPSTNTWAVDGPFASQRSAFGAATVGSAVYAIGGETLAGGTLNTVEAYDTSVHVWTAKRSMPTSRSRLGVATINNLVFVVGGMLPNQLGTGALEAYDPSSDVWTSRAPMPTPRMASAVAVVNNILYVIGGIAAPGDASLNTVEAYDPATNTWTTRAPMPTTRHFIAAGVVNNVIYVFGGVHFTGPQGPDLLALVEAYDPIANRWTTMPSMPAPRDGLGVAVVGNTAYAIGGDFNAPVTDTLDAFTP